MDIPGYEEPVNTAHIVMISDSFLMEAIDEEHTTQLYPEGKPVRRVETGESAKDFMDKVIDVYPGATFVRTAKRGGDYVNARYIDDIYSYGMTLDVDPKMMDREIRTTYTGTEMSQQIEQSIRDSDERLDAMSEAEKHEYDHRNMGWQLAHGDKYVQDPESGKIVCAQMSEKQATSGRRLPDISGIESADVPSGELLME